MQDQAVCADHDIARAILFASGDTGTPSQNPALKEFSKKGAKQVGLLRAHGRGVQAGFEAPSPDASKPRHADIRRSGACTGARTGACACACACACARTGTGTGCRWHRGLYSAAAEAAPLAARGGGRQARRRRRAA